MRVENLVKSQKSVNVRNIVELKPLSLKCSSLPQQLQGPRCEEAGLFLWSMSCAWLWIPYSSVGKIFLIVKWIPLIEQRILKRITRILKVLKFHVATEYCLVAKLYSTLCNSMDCSRRGSTVHGISQARILEWVAISFSRRSSQPRDHTCVSCMAGKFFITESPAKPNSGVGKTILNWVRETFIGYGSMVSSSVTRISPFSWIVITSVGILWCRDFVLRFGNLLYSSTWYIGKRNTFLSSCVDCFFLSSFSLSLTHTHYFFIQVLTYTKINILNGAWLTWLN